MDTKGFEEFVAAIRENAAIERELDALDGQPYDAYCAGFVAVGGKHGYTFSTDEVEELVEEVIADQSLKSGELTDQQLEAVAGGKGGGGGVVRGIIEAIVKNVDPFG